MSDDSSGFQKVELTASTSEPMVRDVLHKPMQSTKTNKRMLVVLSLVVVLAGIGSGYALSQLMPTKTATTSQAQDALPTAANEIKVGTVYGTKDENVFPDKVEGVLVKGGVDGEGSHHLLRPGGKSQIVYLNSTTVDLDLFLDHKVKVAGETFSAQKAGWLMDVGRIEVVELNAEKPFEE